MAMRYEDEEEEEEESDYDSDDDDDELNAFLDEVRRNGYACQALPLMWCSSLTTVLVSCCVHL